MWSKWEHIPPKEKQFDFLLYEKDFESKSVKDTQQAWTDLKGEV